MQHITSTAPVQNEDSFARVSIDTCDGKPTSMMPHLTYIAPVRNLNISEYTCYADFKDEIRELEDGRFMLQHKSDSAKNVTVSTEVWE